MNPMPMRATLAADTQPCRCSPVQIRRYLNRVSGPLLDRIDLHVEVVSMEAHDIASAALEEPSSAIRARVVAARELQPRAMPIRPFAPMHAWTARSLALHCHMTRAADALLAQACSAMGLSNRAATRVIKVARTIADLAASEEIQDVHLAEAVQYRSLDRKYWG